MGFTYLFISTLFSRTSPTLLVLDFVAIDSVRLGFERDNMLCYNAFECVCEVFQQKYYYQSDKI